MLVEVQRRGTIAAAARALSYTPSAVSQQLIALERETGVTLLERDGRRVRPTSAAQALAARAERIISELEVAEYELAAERREARGPLLIGSFPTAAEVLLIPALAELRAEHPGIAPAVRQLLPEEGIALLRSGELDVLLAKTYDSVAEPRAGGLERRDLFTEELVVALPEGHPAAGTGVDLGDLEDADWIAGAPETVYGEVVEQACRAAGFRPRIVHRAEEVGVQLALVAGDAGVALVPSLAHHVAVPRVVFAELVRPRLCRHVYALTRRGAQQRPEISALLEVLAARCLQLNAATAT
ncbi:MAG: LysR family transcriptional regulator [Gaiellaceae bacterium]